MLSKQGGTSNRAGPECREVETEAVVGDAASLLHPGHAFSDFHKNPTIRGERAELILGNDLFGDHVQGHLHILLPIHRGIVVKIDDAKGHELVRGSVHRAVDQELSCCQASAGSVGDTREFQFVTAKGDAYAMHFSLVGPDTQDEASVHDHAPCRNIVAPHQKNYVGANWHASADSLSLSA